MHSSTSNFEESAASALPHLHFARIFAAAICLAVTIVAGLEIFLRSRGFLPNVDDTIEFWAAKRSQVYSSRGRKKIVLLGSSRAQLGLVPDSFRRAFPDMEVVHLGLVQKSCYAVMEDLAEDPKFDGWIVCDIMGPYFKDPRSAPYVRHYREHYDGALRAFGNFDDHVNTVARAWVQSRFALLAPGMYQKLTFLNPGQPPSQWMDFDRYRPTDYWGLGRRRWEEIRRKLWVKLEREPRPYGPGKERAARLFATGELSRLNELMTAKGGKIFFVRMPTCDELLDLDEQDFPREAWNKTASMAGIPAVHFLDDVHLRLVRCPDRSHLDYRDAARFSDRLAEILKRLVEKTDRQSG